MLNKAKMDAIHNVLDGYNRKSLYSRAGRRQLGKAIAISIGMFEGRVQDFMDELDGLNWLDDVEYAFFLEYIERGL